MPGHKAKLAAFFTVVDEIYPRSKIVEQIKAVTPEQQRQKRQRLPSAKNRQAQPLQLQNQKTLL
jgi:hypothetical protein